MSLSKTRIAELTLLLVAFIWGTSYGVAKGALVFYPVMGFLCVRFILTFVLLLPFLHGHLRAAILPGLALGSILLGIFLSETYGVAQTTASNAAFLISLCVVLTPIVDWAVFRHRPTGEAIAIACLSLVGAMMLTGTSGVDMNGGDWLIILAAVLRAFMVCSTKRLLQNAKVSTMALTAVQVGVVGFGSLVIMLLTVDAIPTLPTELSFWGASIYLVLFCTLFAFFAQNHALQHISPTRASLLMGSEPLFGACFAALWLNEQLTPLAWCGGVLIVVASLIGIRPQRMTKAVASA